MNQGFWRLCFIQDQLQWLNMASVTSDDKYYGGWGNRCFFHNVLYSFQPALSPCCRKPGLRTCQRCEHYPKTDFWARQFLFGNDFISNSIFSVFHFACAQTNGCLEHLTQDGVPAVLRQSCPIGCTGWREIYKVETKLEETAPKHRMQRLNHIWVNEMRSRGVKRKEK